MTPYARSVLDAVDAIPPGRVSTYGDVAELAGVRGARSVGRVLARYGAEVPWHRVVRADGRPAPCHGGLAVRLLAAEGVVVDGAGRVPLHRVRWDGGTGPAVTS